MVAENDAVTISHEHDGAQWVRVQDMRELPTDEVIARIAQGDDRIVALVGHIRTDLDRYLRRVSQPAVGGRHT